MQTKTPFESLFSKYSYKKYYLSDTLFNILRRKRKKEYKFPCKHEEQCLFEMFTNNCVLFYNTAQTKKLSITISKKNHKNLENYFYMCLFSDGSSSTGENCISEKIIEISPELQFLICLKARPMEGRRVK